MSVGADDGGPKIRYLAGECVEDGADSAGANEIGWLDSYTVDFALCRARDYPSYISRRRSFPLACRPAHVSKLCLFTLASWKQNVDERFVSSSLSHVLLYLFSVTSVVIYLNHMAPLSRFIPSYSYGGLMTSMTF